jgi:hydroxymethylpyrimidine pyrophosphatase-like HAD family hydrolase
LPGLAPPPDTSPFHLVSDLDGTWIPSFGNGDALRRLEAFLACRPGAVLTFATGRYFESALGLLDAQVLLMPDHLVSDVGTALHHQDAAGRWSEDQVYARMVNVRWDSGLRERLERIGLPEGVRFQAGLAPLRRLALEALPGHDLAQAAADLRLALAAVDSPATVLASGTRWLDVLPPGVDKGSPVEFMAQRWGLPRPLIACGDSANDLGLFRIADVAILMPDSGMDPAWTGRGRVLAAPRPGPEGILEVLLDLEGGPGEVRP